MKVRVAIYGQKDIKQALESASTKSIAGVKLQTKKSSFRIQRSAKSSVSVNIGHLRDTIDSLPINNWLGGKIGTNTDYAEYIEHGTGPAAGHQRYFPPPGSLIYWMKRKGIPENLEYVIRRSIFLKGTKPKPFLYPAFRAEKPQYIIGLEKALKLSV